MLSIYSSRAAIALQYDKITESTSKKLMLLVNFLELIIELTLEALELKL